MTITSERIRDRVLGDERRIGVWIVPLFLIVALLGATLAGSVVALYYAQQVRQLEATTADARNEVEQARQEITATASEAQETIDAQMRQAREELAQEPPVDSPKEAGVFAVSADHAADEVRVGSAFAISSKPDQTYLATTYRLVATGEEAVRSVRVFLEDGPVEARVHNYDRARDIATLELPVGPLPVPEWRPPDEAVERGDPLYLTGLAGPGTPSVLEGRVAGVSDEAVVPTAPVNAFLAGAPLLDAAGRVVAMASLAYAPFGPVDGDPLYAVPVRQLCARAVECSQADVGTEGIGEPGGVGESPSEGGAAERPRARPPTPPPQPPPESRQPSSEQTGQQTPSGQQPSQPPSEGSGSSQGSAGSGSSDGSAGSGSSEGSEGSGSSDGSAGSASSDGSASESTSAEGPGQPDSAEEPSSGSGSADSPEQPGSGDESGTSGGSSSESSDGGSLPLPD